MAGKPRQKKQAVQTGRDIIDLFNKAGRLIDTGQTDPLFELYQDWLARNDNHPLAYAVLFNLGCAFMGAGRHNDAARTFAEALRRNPHFLNARFNLGMAHEKMGRLEEALKSWSPLISVPDDVSGEQRNLLLMGLNHSGRVLESLGRPNEAEGLLERSLALYPAQAVVSEHCQALRQMHGTLSGLGQPAPDRAEESGSGIHIYQICYSKQTLLNRDPGFLCLDHLGNERPDWREYWPIRRFLLNASLTADHYYGFLSPKFKAKTTLDAARVHEFILSHGGVPDVFLFSPFFDQGAFPINIFEQGLAQHHDIGKLFADSVALAAPGVDIATLIMDSRNIVFCNYLVAKPAFWEVWLERCERIFAEAEAGESALAANLNADTNHDGGMAPNKVFVIERMASLLLSTNRCWKVAAYDPTLLPFSPAGIAKFRRELILLDALKIAYTVQGYGQYLALYSQIRQSIGSGKPFFL